MAHSFTKADYYFVPHDMHDMPKIKAIVAKCGIGAGFVMHYLFCCLCKSDNFHFSIDKITVEILCSERKISTESFRNMVTYMTEVEVIAYDKASMTFSSNFFKEVCLSKLFRKRQADKKYYYKKKKSQEVVNLTDEQYNQLCSRGARPMHIKECVSRVASQVIK